MQAHKLHICSEMGVLSFDWFEQSTKRCYRNDLFLAEVRNVLWKFDGFLEMALPVKTSKTNLLTCQPRNSS